MLARVFSSTFLLGFFCPRRAALPRQTFDSLYNSGFGAIFIHHGVLFLSSHYCPPPHHVRSNTMKQLSSLQLQSQKMKVYIQICSFFSKCHLSISHMIWALNRLNLCVKYSLNCPWIHLTEGVRDKAVVPRTYHVTLGGVKMPVGIIAQNDIGSFWCQTKKTVS